jgi:hypothetical protein
MDLKPQENTITPESKTKKKKYGTPRLVVYGDIRDLTKATSPTGMGDGGMAGLVKTA